MRYGECTYEEIARHAAQGAVLLLPMGCTEQQGPHLPVDFDTWFAEALCLAAAERASAAGTPALVAPVVPFGPTPEHRNFGAGYVDLPRGVHADIVRAALTSFAEQGFARLIVWQGCGGHDVGAAVSAFNGAWRGRAFATVPASPWPGVWREAGGADVPAGHADSFTTSVSLYLRPETVRLDRIPGPSGEPDWNEPDLDFRRYSTSGTIGDARHGSAELGRRIWELGVAWLAGRIAL